MQDMQRENIRHHNHNVKFHSTFQEPQGKVRKSSLYTLSLRSIMITNGIN